MDARRGLHACVCSKCVHDWALGRRQHGRIVWPWACVCDGAHGGHRAAAYGYDGIGEIECNWVLGDKRGPISPPIWSYESWRPQHCSDCGGVREAGYGDCHSHRDGARRRWDCVIGGGFGCHNHHTAVGNGRKVSHGEGNTCGRRDCGAGCFGCHRIGDDVRGRVEFPYKFGHTFALAVVWTIGWTTMAGRPGVVGVDVAVGSHLKGALNDG